MNIKPLSQINKFTYIKQSTNCKIKSSYSPNAYFKHYDLYLKGRKDFFHIINAFSYTLGTLIDLVGLRIIKANNKMIAGYTYKLRKNKFKERSLYVDSLARDFLNPKSKPAMLELYQDIKTKAIKKKAKEITLFVYFKDKNLKKRYEQLGFKQDLTFYNRLIDLMRVRTENFINNSYFKTLKYKQLTGVKSILQTKAQ